MPKSDNHATIHKTLQECSDAAIRVVTSPWPEARIAEDLPAHIFVG